MSAKERSDLLLHLKSKFQGTERGSVYSECSCNKKLFVLTWNCAKGPYSKFVKWQWNTYRWYLLVIQTLINAFSEACLFGPTMAISCQSWIYLIVQVFFIYFLVTEFLVTTECSCIVFIHMIHCCCKTFIKNFFRLDCGHTWMSWLFNFPKSNLELLTSLYNHTRKWHNLNTKNRVVTCHTKL